MKENLLKHKNFIPILFLLLCSIWTIYQVLFTKYEHNGFLYDRVFSVSNYIAFVILIADLIVYFKYRNHFKSVVILTIIIGLLGISNYHANSYGFTFIFISFEPTIFVIGIYYLIVNYKYVQQKLFGEQVPEELATPDFEKAQEFKIKYLNKTNEELIELINDKRFVKEAKIAASELLKERNSQSPTANIS
jgi:hypothetical protein